MRGKMKEFPDEKPSATISSPTKRRKNKKTVTASISNISKSPGFFLRGGTVHYSVVP